MSARRYRRLATAVLLLAVLAVLFTSVAQAAVLAVGALGGRDMPVGRYTTLRGPWIIEGATGDVGLGLVDLELSPGFVFESVPSSITVTVFDRGECDASNRPLRIGPSRTSSARTMAIQNRVQIEVTQRSTGTCRGILAWSGLRVRADAPASGNLRRGGTSAIVGLPPGSTWAP